jgi:Flp pilus assembly protein TadG
MLASRPNRCAGRNGAAATELALLLPVLCLICMITTDYARLFHTLSQLSDRARAGAISYATHPTTPLLDIQLSVIADPGTLGASLAASVNLGVNGLGHSTVQVTATSEFKTLVNYPGIPHSIALSRRVVMMVSPV